MRKYFNMVEDNVTGKPISGAVVKVLTAPTAEAGTAVTIYSDDGVTETTTEGQVTTDQYGYYEFYVADGLYTLEQYVNGTLKKVIEDVEIFAGAYDEVAALDTRVTALENTASAVGTYNATSSTSIAIATGAKGFNIEQDKAIVVGQFYLAASSADVTNYMYGQITAYNPSNGVLQMNVTVTGGSGTHADWVLSPSFYIPALNKLGDTAEGEIVFAAADGTDASINIPHGSAPASPSNGDVWTTTTGVFARINGTTYQLATIAGTETFTNKSLTSPNLAGTTTPPFTITDGASVTIDPANGDVQIWTLGANRTPTLTSITTGKGILLGVNDGSAFTITLSGVTWITGGGSAPTLKTSGFTWFSIFNVGGTLYAALIGDDG